MEVLVTERTARTIRKKELAARIVVLENRLKEKI
jgi:hypothetical protein